MSEETVNSATGEVETVELPIETKRPTLSGKVVDLAMEVFHLQKSRASSAQVAKKKRNRARAKVARKSRSKNRRG